MLPIILALIFIAIIFIVVIAGRPDEFCVTRTATIPAPPEKVFAQVNELRAWEAWSPWAKKDPNAKSTYSGPASGVGASMAWAGNKEVGEGSMTIVESRVNELVGFKLEFLKPFKATNTAEFTFQPRGNQTVVSWTMTGKSNFFFKVFGLFMNCDDMVGKDFDKGLANLKSVVATK
ncbi:MAG TPA: SRPBCC family protein [Candidatus Baltobacteraceae bacterium]|nr:SRPBCC family protein [Candidatus Baltobacteraceae bacterium]